MPFSENFRKKSKKSLFAGKCVRQQFNANAKHCYLKNPSDGSGVIAIFVKHFLP